MKNACRITVALMLAISALIPALPAHAAAVSMGVGYEFQFVPEMEHGKLGLIAVATVPESSKLPATVRIPVPNGYHPHWVGEVFSDDHSKDFKVEYTEGAAGDAAYLEVTVTKSRTVQAEGIIGDMTYEGGVTKFATSVACPDENPHLVTITEVIPKAGGVPSGTPAVTGTPITNEDGDKLYTLAATEFGPTAPLEISQSYETNGNAVVSTESTATAASSSNPIAIIVIIIVALVLVGGIVLLINKKRREESYYE